MSTSSSRAVLLAGGSGLIGRELLARLLAHAQVSAVHALLRRPAKDWPSDAKLHTLQIDFAALPKLPAIDDVYIALGTTIKQAGSQAAFRAVDFDAVIATARAARAAGAKRLLLVTAMGADARSGVFYNRVKGEVEAAVQALGFESVVIARPSLLNGDREALGQPSRKGEAFAIHALRPLLGLMPKSIRPIEASDVAAALVRAAWQAGPGLTLLSSGAMQPS